MAARAEGREDKTKPTIVGRYILDGEVASGGMASVHHGRRIDDPPPGTTVAIKRVHPHLAKDKRFASMFIDEARLVSRIRHPNVIRTLDIIASDDECLLVMEYVHGEALGRLLRLCDERGARPPLDILSAIISGALAGLQASHDATNAAGAPLNIVHRDISPQNIMVGADGVARVLDFGVAKAAGSLHVTRDGEIKGKLAYMSPEQVSAKPLDRRTDVYAAGVVLWEAVTQLPLFDGENEAAIIASVMRQEIAVPSTIVPGLPRDLDGVIMHSLEARPDRRFSSAREMAEALTRVVPPAPVAKVAAWVETLAGEGLRKRLEMIQARAKGVPLDEAVTQRSGVTEVFFTTGGGGRGGGGGGASVLEENAAKASAVLQLGVKNLESGLDGVLGALPPNVRGPAYKYRWAIFGVSVTFFALFLAWAFKPNEPPPSSISAAPDGVSPSPH